MRASAAAVAVALLALVSVVPGLCRAEAGTVAGGGFVAYWYNATANETLLEATWDSPRSLDVFVLTPSQFSDYLADYSWKPHDDVRLVQSGAIFSRFRVPLSPGETAIILVDNSVKPRSLDQGEGHLDASFNLSAKMTQVVHYQTVGDLARTLTFQQPYYEFPFWPGVAITGLAIYFLLTAIPCAIIAALRDRWHLVDVAIIAAIGMLLSTRQPDGTYTNALYIAAPAVVISIVSFVRKSQGGAMGAAVLSMSFFGILLGPDVLDLLLRSDFVRAAAAVGDAQVIGAGGWSDGLFVAPATALGGVAIVLLYFAGPKGLLLMLPIPHRHLVVQGRRVNALILEVDIENRARHSASRIVLRLSHPDSAIVATVRVGTIPAKQSRRVVIDLPTRFENAMTIHGSAQALGMTATAFTIVKG